MKMQQGNELLSESKLIPEQVRERFRVCRYLRNGVTPCADVKVCRPISGEVLCRQVSSKRGEEVIRKKIAAAAETLYREVRPAVLRCELEGGGLTLKKYLSYDLAFLRQSFPKAYGDREVSALLRCADALTADPEQYASADAILPALRPLEGDRALELAVLSMLSKAFDELKKLGLVQRNPLSAYAALARKNANRQKAEQREHTNAALPSYAVAALLREYDENILRDARYFAIPFAMLGLSADVIAALSFEDVVSVEAELSLRVASRVVRPGTRLCKIPLESVYQARLLCINFLRRETEEWERAYRGMGLDPLARRTVPLCAYGRRAQPRRCSPRKIEAFLQAALARCCKGEYGNPTRTLHKTFLVFGEETLAAKPFLARYLTGMPPETVDERVYISFTAPRIQRELSAMVQEVLARMREGDTDEV